jgi:hypothetical protein
MRVGRRDQHGAMKSALRIALAGALAAALVSPAVAQPHRSPHSPTYRGPIHLDQRYHHDHWYPGIGFGFSVLPAGAISIAHGGGNWFFQGGVWFRPVGPNYVVALPPAGIVVPYLPPAYVTLWIAGAPYYYANGVYYAAAPGGYTVVAPPPGADVAQAVPLPPSFVIYPRNGQTSAQTDADRAACNQWAGAQPGGNADATLFQRAFAACMEGRGYTVR